MNKNLLFFCFWIVNYAVLPIQAQFYTITDDTMHAQIDDDAESSMTPRQDKEGIGHNEVEGGFFAVTEGHDIESMCQELFVKECEWAATFQRKKQPIDDALIKQILQH